MDIADRIKALRGDMTREQFTERLDISAQTLYKYENRVGKPTVDFVEQACKEFNISYSWLISGEGPMRPIESPQPAESAPQHPASTAETILCTRCAEMAAKVEKVEQQRDDLMQENRQWAAKTEQLLRENGDLRERCATLTERQSWLNEHKTGNTL